MQNFWGNSQTIKKSLINVPSINLFLDFDGTLSPFVSNPAKVKLPEKTKQILEKLTSLNNIQLAVVSGRTLEDVKRNVNIKGIMYAGNHGMEWEFNERKGASKIPPTTLKLLNTIKFSMDEISKNFEGSFVEDKLFSVAFHYRGVQADKKSIIEEMLHNHFSHHIQTGEVALFLSKDTYDLHADIGWTKGHIVQDLLKLVKDDNGLVIYIGDSATDEDAFKMLTNHITIKVGYTQETKAKYFLKDENDVRAFLEWLFALVNT